jgi:hypothetical protein
MMNYSQKHIIIYEIEDHFNEIFLYIMKIKRSNEGHNILDLDFQNVVTETREYIL